MLQFKLIGYFREIFPAEKAAPYMERREVSDVHEQAIIQYLLGGRPTAAAGVCLRDAFDDDKYAGPLVMLTDGIWEWPSVLPYYIEHYHIKLPHEFITHLREAGVLTAH